MNAYELAEIMTVHDESRIWEHGLEIANMLRQQADRIAELEETINACYSVQKMQAEEVYKGNDRIAELEQNLSAYIVELELHKAMIQDLERKLNNV